jgi:hypothetical protein
MRRSLSFVTGCVFLLCGFSSDPPFVPVSHPENYDALKTVMQQAYEKGLLKSGIEYAQKEGPPGTYDMSQGSTCHEPTDYLGSFDDPSKIGGVLLNDRNDDIAQLVQLAVDMVVWTNDLRKLGVPERIWRPILNVYEDRVLRSKPSTFNIVELLNHEMARAGISTPKFIFRPECGAGGIDVHLELKPVEGQLFLIPVFLYKLCEVQHLNPLDLKSCDRWKEIFSERVGDVSGDYMYLARWTDGVVRCGTLTYDDFKKSSDEDKYNIVITKLQSPECRPAW